MASEDSTPRVAYRGFVSYSHRDAGIGRTIHRRLEAYRLPKHLAGSETARGIVPAKLIPIFRDREELSAGESLSDQVQAALAASESLIVLCSPQAKASEWVAKEIETFRALHPGRPILAALIEGEPGEAFPDALTEGGAEPIAADFRKGQDGQRLGLLKLVAGMTGVTLDALVQRDAQRRTRRVMAVTLAALLAVLVLAALLVVALRARSEAERQREQAEGLVEYMLTDLRDKLKGVGSLKVMSAVNDRAMKYYGAQGDLSRLPPESLDRRARLLHAMGEDDEKRGDLDKALAKFTEAHRTTKAVLERRTDDADAVFAHAQSEFWVGDAAWRRKDRATTTRYWTSYLKSAEKFAVVSKDKAGARMEIAYAHGNLCDLNSNSNFDLTEARRHCATAIALVKSALAIEPENTAILQSLANRYGWLAQVDAQRKDWLGAIENRRSERKVIERLLSADPGNFEYGVRSVWPDLGEARAHLALTHYSEASRLATAALRRGSRLADLESQNDEVALLNLKSRSLILRVSGLSGHRTAFDLRVFRAALYSDAKRLGPSIQSDLRTYDTALYQSVTGGKNE